MRLLSTQLALYASEAGSALLTRGGRDHGNTVADFELRDAVADFDHFTGRIGAEHVGQSNFHRIPAGAHDKIQSAID